MPFFSPHRYWLPYSLLLIVLFTAKGFIYLCILPPFEGWDEYQHLAYIDHLQVQGERPVLNKSRVPRELLREIVDYPVSQFMLEQTEKTGALDYKTFFTGKESPGYNEQHGDIKLYQAQHGELYYQLMIPLLSQLPNKTNVLHKIFFLRIVNFTFVALSLLPLLLLIPYKVPNRAYAALLGLLIISQPLLLINSLRISNDALAIMLGTWVVIIGLLPKLRRNAAVAIAIGLLLGLSCWAKSTSLVFLPFWACCLAVSWYKKEISFKRLVSLLFMSYSIALAVLFKYFLFNFDNYELLFVMQEALVNRANSTGLPEILQAVKDSKVFSDIFTLWTRDAIWVGGWSMLKVHNIRNISLVLLSVSMLAWAFRIFAPQKDRPLVQPETTLLCFLLCLLTSLTIGWHYIQCIIAWGVDGATSCPWYLSAILPFFLIFIFDSAGRWSARTCSVLMLSLIGIYFYADFRGIFTMMSFYSGGEVGPDALIKLAIIRPDWLGTRNLVMVSFFFIGMFVSMIALQIQLHFAKHTEVSPT